MAASEGLMGGDDGVIACVMADELECGREGVEVKVDTTGLLGYRRRRTSIYVLV